MRSLLLLATLAALLLPCRSATAETAAEKSIAQQIGRQLENSGQLRNYRIGVKYQDGVAWLSGNVTDPQQRETAVQLAQQMLGVEHVVCQLECSGGGTTLAQSPSLPREFNEQNMAPAGLKPAANAMPAMPTASQLEPSALASTAAVNAPVAGRGNMPRPMNGIASRGRSAVRQVSAQSVYPASASCPGGCAPGDGGMAMAGAGSGFVPHGMARGASYDNAQMPGYAWPSYAAYPNYAALTYPKQYSPTAWPYIGPFYPYPQVPLAWRKVSLEWDDGWWFLDFSAHNSSH